MVKYSYDAYGKCTVASDSTTSKIGTINPFRFKGYYLDTETGFYYCNSRYYVPDWGRWFTADSIEYLDTNSVNGMNLYAYCNNDPINYCDPSGHFPFLLLTAIAGAFIGFGIASYKDYNDDGIWFNGSAGRYIGYTLGGAAIGALVGAGISGALTGSFVSNCATVKAGAILAYNLAKTSGIVATAYMLLDNLSNSFNSSLHVFWSGGNVAKNQAVSYAQENGGITLEMTRLGQYLETKPYNYDAWTYASQNFANQVRNGGVARAILYYPGMRPDAIWLTEEAVLLKKLVEIIIGSL